MPIDDKIQLSIDDLKKIVHGLHMASFGFVEDDAMDEIKLMIKALPSPEKIDQMLQTPQAIKNLQVAIGRIMKLIELYGKRDIEYKVRYKSRTNLPPRYKVLDYKGSNMKTREEVKSKMAMDLVKLSSEADEMGYGEISSKLLKCAKMTISDPMIKEAQFGALKDMWQGVKNVGKGVGRGIDRAIGKGLEKAKDIGQSVKETYQVGKFSNRLQRVLEEIRSVYADLREAVDKAVDTTRAQKLIDMAQKLANMYTVGQEVYKLDFSDAVKAEPGTYEITNDDTPPPIPQDASTENINMEDTESFPVKEIAEDVPSKFKKGEPVIYKGQPHDVLEVLPSGYVQIKSKSTGTIFAVSPDKLTKENKAQEILSSTKFNLKLHKLAKRG